MIKIKRGLYIVSTDILSLYYRDKRFNNLSSSAAATYKVNLCLCKVYTLEQSLHLLLTYRFFTLETETDSIDALLQTINCLSVSSGIVTVTSAIILTSKPFIVIFCAPYKWETSGSNSQMF